MLSSRWRKVLRDLWGNKTRTLLVVLSVAVGVFAIGTVMHTQIIVSEELTAIYPQCKLPSFTLYTSAFDDELVNVVRRMEGVQEAEGRSVVVVRVQTGPQEWKPLQLFAIANYNDIRINKVWPERTFDPNPAFGAERGEWPPPDRGVLFERASLLMPGLVPADAQVGGYITIESTDGKRRQLRIAGLAHEPGRVPATFASTAYGYITLDTLEWLTGSRGLVELAVIVSGDPRDRDNIVRVAREVEIKVEKSGRIVEAKEIPEPGKRPFVDDIFQGLTLILGVLGLMALFLSAFLIVNTISAILVQHVRQIGVMKAIGARGGQVTKMYLSLVLAFGLLALVIAVPLAALVASQTSQLLAGFINVRFPAFGIPPRVLAIEILIGLLVPLLAALLPVLRGTRLTVREALTDYGIGKGPIRARRGLFARSKATASPQARASRPSRFRAVIGRLRVLLLPRPVVLSLRNAFRHKLRMLLTLATLVMGGTIFITVFTVRASMLLTLDELLEMWRFDAQIQFNQGYRAEQLQREALSVPGVTKAEAFGLSVARRLRSDDSESETILILAPEARTELIHPAIIEGRWLLPEDENAVVINVNLQKAEPDLKVGDEITLKIGDRKTTWRIVGVMRAIGGGMIVYANYPYHGHVTGSTGRAGMMWLVTERHDAAFQARVMEMLEQSFKQKGIRISQAITTAMIRQQNEFYFNIIVVLLAIMALLMAIVGGLGLMGTMSINVLERTREIGVMRAIGASNGAVRRIVISEGLLVGVLSWLIGTFLASLVGRALSDAVGMVFFRIPLSYTFSRGGALIWLVLVIVLSTLASVVPARNAARLSVREALAYE